HARPATATDSGRTSNRGDGTAGTPSHPSRDHAVREGAAMTTVTQTVVVGVEGTDSSRAALVWAARTAAERGAALRLVHAAGPRPEGLAIAFADEFEARATAVLRDAEERARAVAPDAATTTELVWEPVGRALTSRAGEGDLLVVGSRRMGAVERLLVGSRA